MKDNKNLKNRNNPEKDTNQTPPPAVPNRAHTEMKNEKNNKKDTGAQSSSNKNCK